MENSASSAGTAASSARDAQAATGAARDARVKRMRGWLGVKSNTHSYGIGDDGGPVSYGDAPNGWNR